MAERLERGAHHQRPQIRAADADIHHISDHLVGIAQPIAAAHFVGEFAHAVQHMVYLRHHIFAVHQNRRIGAVAQRHMQRGAVFGGVDFFTAKHLLHALGQAGFACQLHQKRQGFIGDAVFGIIHFQAAHLQPIALGAPRVGGKQFAHMVRLGGIKMLPQFAPGGQFLQVFHYESSFSCSKRLVCMLRLLFSSCKLAVSPMRSARPMARISITTSCSRRVTIGV